MRLILACLVAVLVLEIPSAAAAQECRRTCRVDETRDNNGCCIPPAARVTPAPAVAQPLPRRCPAGTTWSDSARACMGRLQCPSGAHPEESHGCVADAVGCPAGSRAEEGRCVADVTCPPNTRLENNACVSDVTCPANTRLEGGHCISSDVTCPAGTTAREGGGCVGDPVCPASTTYTEGRGCVGVVVCPRGSHLDNGTCASDVVCLEGTHSVEGQGCVDVCLEYPHSTWDSTRRACTCAHGFTAQGGQCVQATTCAAGMHMEGTQCVADVVCPYGYEFRRGTGCVDPRAEAAVARERERLAASARRTAAAQREQAQRQWAAGPALQLWAGGGYGYFLLPVVAQYGTDTSVAGSRVGANWSNYALRAGLTYSSAEFIFGIGYTRIADGATQASVSNWMIRPNTLDLVTIGIGQQGAGPTHSWRVMLEAGVDFPVTMAVAGLSYQSLFRIVAGLFIGVDIQVLGSIRGPNFNGTYCYDPGAGAGCGMTNTSTVIWQPGVGGSAALVLGYSLH